MIKAGILSAAIGAGLVLPPAAELYVPPKPAIVRAESLDVSKHMLAMPLSLGPMFRKSAAAGPTMGYLATLTSTASQTSYTFSNVNIGSGSGFVALLISVGNDVSMSAPTIGSTSFAYLTTSGGAPPRVFLAYGTPSADGTLTLTFGAAAGNVACSVLRIPTTSSTPLYSRNAIVASATSVAITSLNTGGFGYNIISVSTHGNTGSTTVSTTNIGPTNISFGNITVGTRIHTYWWATATTTSTAGTVTHSWSTAANGGQISGTWSF